MGASVVEFQKGLDFGPLEIVGDANFLLGGRVSPHWRTDGWAVVGAPELLIPSVAGCGVDTHPF